MSESDKQEKLSVYFEKAGHCGPPNKARKTRKSKKKKRKAEQLKGKAIRLCTVSMDVLGS